MNYKDNYFQSYQNYFWQWEDDGEVVAIPESNTIAYKQFIIEVFEVLKIQGMPPFGALLAAIIATNPSENAGKNLNEIREIWEIYADDRQDADAEILSNAMHILYLIAELPIHYKQGKNRILVLQTVFEGCHNRINSRKANQYYDYLSNEDMTDGLEIIPQSSGEGTYLRDINTLACLKKRFTTVDDLIDAIGSLPKIEAETLVLSELSKEDNTRGKDWLEELNEDEKTFYVGSLIKQIWGGLHIPAHSASPSEQPLGGVSDLTNKGDLSRLLISEFANDDLVFLSRLANNEALYIQREIPPINRKQKRVILLDISLKNWGTPKNIAFALALAIVKHPKTIVGYEVFLVGKKATLIDIEPKQALIDAMQYLNADLYAVNGLASYFKDFKPDANTEIFVITAKETLKQAAMQRAVSELNPFVNYWIYTDEKGNIDLYKRQQISKKHLQSIKLPLDELWKNPPKSPKSATRERNDKVNIKKCDYPILFRNTSAFSKILRTNDGAVFALTKDKMLLMRYKKEDEEGDSGWDLLYTNLPFKTEIAEMGLFENGDYILLMYNTGKKSIFLLNLGTEETKTIDFREWRGNMMPDFFFHEKQFHHAKYNLTHSVNPYTYEITSNINYVQAIYKERENMQQELNKKYKNDIAIFKNITNISISDNQNLIVNERTLTINSYQVIMLSGVNTKAITTDIVATKTGNLFTFAEGSTVEILDAGAFILKSSDKSIPTIYLLSLIDSSLSFATNTEFIGSDYFYKKYTAVLNDDGLKINNILHITQRTTIFEIFSETIGKFIKNIVQKKGQIV